MFWQISIPSRTTNRSEERDEAGMEKIETNSFRLLFVSIPSMHDKRNKNANVVDSNSFGRRIHSVCL